MTRLATPEVGSTQHLPITPGSRRHLGERRDEVNVGDFERWLSVIGGGALAAFGLSRGNLPGLALGLVGGSLVYRGLSGHCPMYGSLGLNTAEGRGPATSIPATHGVKVEKSITIFNKTPEELYHFWHNFENLPCFMRHLQSVKMTGLNQSHWVAKGPMGMEFEWDAVTHTDNPPETIGWRSLEGSEVDTAGSVHFRPAPGGRGTELRVVLKYDPPAGKTGAAVARLFGQAPEQQIVEDLRRFKQLVEAGEIPTTQGQPACR